MSDAENVRGYPWVLLAMPAAFFAYVVSCGPVAILLNRGHLTRDTFRAVYAPHVWVAEHSPRAVGRWMEDYLEWWAGPPTAP